MELLINSELQTSRGLNQEMSIKRSCDIHWGPYYSSLLTIIAMFSSIINIPEDIEKNDTYQNQNAKAHHLLELFQSFDFILAYI